MTKKQQVRRDWIRANAGKGLSAGQLASAYAAAFKIRDESRAADEVKQLLQAEQAVEVQLEESGIDRHIALGHEILNEARRAGAYGAAAGLWAAIGKAKGHEAPQKIQVEAQVYAAPHPDVVRRRIEVLKKDPRIQERMRQAQLDTDVMTSADPEVRADVAAKAALAGMGAYDDDPMSPGARLPPRELPAPESDDQKPDPHAENILATHLKGVRAFD